MAEPKRTAFAMQAMDLAAMFEVVLGTRTVGGDPGYVPQLSAPEGPSTAGGKQSLQHVTLVSKTGSGTLVIGSADQVERTARLRTHDHVALLFRQRYKGAELPISADDYRDLHDKLRTFFREQGMTVTPESVPLPEQSDPPPTRSPATARGMLILSGLIAVAIVALLLLQLANR